MGKYIVWLIIAVTIGSGVVSADIEHKVARGETIESIAEKYGITTEKLLEVNKDAADLFYIGQRLTIPIVETSDDQSEFSQTNNMTGMISPMERGLAEDAKRHFENKEWGKLSRRIIS